MSDLVRVTNLVTGHQYNTSATLAKSDPALRIVDRPTVDRYGVDIPPLYAAIPPVLAKEEPTAKGTSKDKDGGQNK